MTKRTAGKGKDVKDQTAPVDPAAGPAQDDTAVIQHQPLDREDHGDYADEVNAGLEPPTDEMLAEHDDTHGGKQPAQTRAEYDAMSDEQRARHEDELQELERRGTGTPGDTPISVEFFGLTGRLAADDEPQTGGPHYHALDRSAVPGDSAFKAVEYEDSPVGWELRAKDEGRISVEDLAAIDARTPGRSPIASMRRQMAEARAAAQPNLLLVGDRTIFKPMLGDTVLILATDLRWNVRAGRTNYLAAIVTATSDDGFGVQPLGVPYCSRAFRFDAFAEFDSVDLEKSGTWRWPPSR